MKHKNKQESEKHWSKEAVKQARPTAKKKKSRQHEDLNELAGRIARESEMVEVGRAAARLVGEVAVDR